MNYSSNLLYVWTMGGDVRQLSFPVDLAGASANASANASPVSIEKEPVAAPKKQTVPEYAIEPFIDNLRRTVSGVNKYSEIPYNNEVSTRQTREPIPLFRFQVEPNKNYKLNVMLRARVDYKYTVPVLAKYSIETNSPTSFMNYRASYVSSHEVNTGEEKTSNTLGSILTAVVDSKLSLIRINATFQMNTIAGLNGVEIRVHHGIKTNDDPEATLYSLEGSYAVLSEITGI
jgi:hypothetical protein